MEGGTLQRGSAQSNELRATIQPTYLQGQRRLLRFQLRPLAAQRHCQQLACALAKAALLS
jgi:hypothetical protein